MNKKDWLITLEKRFNAYQHFYPTITFEKVLNSLSEIDIEILMKLEETGEVGFVREKDGYYEFFDLSIQTPQRLSLCYDYEARINRKNFLQFLV